jgi:hypothetical protein
MLIKNPHPIADREKGANASAVSDPARGPRRDLLD